MINIENLLKTMSYEGNWGNLVEPRLELKTIDISKNCLYFSLAKDYSSNIRNISTDDIKRLIPVDKGMNVVCGSDDIVCYLEITREELITLVSQVIVFSFLENMSSYKNLSMETNGRNSNIGACCHTLTYMLKEWKIPISTTLRIKKDIKINDIENIRKKFIKYAKELGIKEIVSSEIMKEKGITSGDIKNLCECFDYDIVDSETVILHLKDFINPKHLLRFKGFNNGYTDFKIWTNGHNGTFTLIKGDNYFTIQWGTSTTCCAEYYWDMQNAIIDCIRIKELMF